MLKSNVLPLDIAPNDVCSFGGAALCLDNRFSVTARFHTDSGSSPAHAVPMTKESGYVCYQLDQQTWKKKRTHDPGQPPEGFTISALEDSDQADLLCDAYARSDREGRRMIQLFAQLSIMEGEGVVPGRFDV